LRYISSTLPKSSPDRLEYLANRDIAERMIKDILLGRYSEYQGQIKVLENWLIAHSIKLS
jgi:hypothetical protein